jgi:hypothetical protein
MPATYDSIATTTLGSANNTITFSSISSNYTDLRIVGALTTDGSEGLIGLRFNNSSGAATTYSSTWIEGTGTTAANGRDTNGNYIQVGYSASTANNPSFITVDVLNYVSSTHKIALTAGYPPIVSGTTRLLNCVGVFRDTSVINRVDIVSFGGSFQVGSTFSLYGIKGA